MRGAAIVSAEVRRLHRIVLASLLQAGARPWSVPPGALAEQRAGTLTRFDLRPIAQAVERGLMPVAFGDVVPDLDWQFSILSADTIAVELVRQGIARRVLFVSDVEGVYESKGPGPPRVIAEITDEVVARLAPAAGAPDVTGGIRGKALAMRTIASLGGDAGLISGLSDGRLTRALRGEPVHGSWAFAGSR